MSFLLALMLQTAPATNVQNNAGEAAFSFRDFTANMTKPKGLSCFRPKSRPGVELCSDPVDKVSDIKLESSLVSFDENGLYYLSLTVADYQAKTLLAALRARYGKTCSEEESEVQNRMGAKFSRITVIWCFSDGKAAFYSPSSKVDEATFSFLATRDKTNDKPKVDF